MPIFDPPPSPGASLLTLVVTDNRVGVVSRTNSSLVYSLTFSEDVFGLDLTGFFVTNGFVSAVTGAGSAWWVSVDAAMGVASGSIGLTLRAGAVSTAVGTWNESFTDASQGLDTVAPEVTAFSPVNQTSGVAVASDLSLDFSETVQKGTGLITLKTAAGITVESYDIAISTHVTLGSNRLTINLGADLNPGTAYHLELPAGTVKDMANNDFAGVNNYSFTTTAPSIANVDLLAYSWKSHTLLDAVSISDNSHSVGTDGNGSAIISAVTEPSLTLTASRAIPSAETSATDAAVNLQDAIAILKMIVGLDVNGAGKPLSPYQALAADFDGDGIVGLTDAIGVLKHVVGLNAPQPAWHFLNETDTSVAGKATLSPGLAATTIHADMAGAAPVHTGLVGYLAGDVDGSYTGVSGAGVLETAYFQTLVAGSNNTLNLTQFGIY